MNIVERKVELVSKQPYEEMLRVNELAIRNCYRSENKISEGSAEKLVRNMVKLGHGAMLEFADVTFHIVTDRATLAQITRHRIASYAVESQRYCLAGDTKLKTSDYHNKLTIEELYNNVINSHNGAWKRMRIEQLDEDTGALVYSGVKNVFYNGIKPAYKLKTKLGYEIVCTNEHEIYTPNGYKQLKELCVGDTIYINGTDVSEPLYKNKTWLYYQSVTLNKCYADIAREFNYKVSTVKSWAKKFNLPKKGMGNHKHMIPWNKGLDERDSRVKRQADALRKYHHNGLNDTGIKKLNNNVKYRKFIGDKCELCGSDSELIVHHIDGNRNNNDKNNFITLCNRCHMQLHHKNLSILCNDTITSIEPVGLQKVYDIEMNSTNHNFVANGIIVHNCTYNRDKFGNNVRFIIPAGLDTETNFGSWKASCQLAEKEYFNLIECGEKAETARSVLPNCVATSIYMKMNMRSLRNFLQLRLSNHAQADIRDIANKMYNIVKEKYPVYVENLIVDGVRFD